MVVTAGSLPPEPHNRSKMSLLMSTTKKPASVAVMANAGETANSDGYCLRGEEDSSTLCQKGDAGGNRGRIIRWSRRPGEEGTGQDHNMADLSELALKTHRGAPSLWLLSWLLSWLPGGASVLVVAVPEAAGTTRRSRMVRKSRRFSGHDPAPAWQTRLAMWVCFRPEGEGKTACEDRERQELRLRGTRETTPYECDWPSREAAQHQPTSLTKISSTKISSTFS